MRKSYGFEARLAALPVAFLGGATLFSSAGFMWGAILGLFGLCVGLFLSLLVTAKVPPEQDSRIRYWLPVPMAAFVFLVIVGSSPPLDILVYSLAAVTGLGLAWRCGTPTSLVAGPVLGGFFGLGAGSLPRILSMLSIIPPTDFAKQCAFTGLVSAISLIPLRKGLTAAKWGILAGPAIGFILGNHPNWLSDARHYGQGYLDEAGPYGAVTGFLTGFAVSLLSSDRKVGSPT